MIIDESRLMGRKAQWIGPAGEDFCGCIIGVCMSNRGSLLATIEAPDGKLHAVDLHKLVLEPKE